MKMKMNLNPDEWIENFIEGNLTDLEKDYFKEKIASDPEFAKLYNERLKLKEAWVRAYDLEKTRVEVSSAIHREKTNKKRQIISFAAAASILLLIGIPAILYFNGNFDRQSINSSKIASLDSIHEISATPQFKRVEEKASFGKADTISLILPIHNNSFKSSDSVLFRWSPALKDTTLITILNEKTRNAVFKEKVAKGKDQFILEKGFLPEGQYEWFLDGFSEIGKFIVIR